MFAHPTEERRLGKVELKDLKKEICDIILKFSYTGRLDDDVTMELFEQADKLQFLELKEQCSKHLIQFIDKDNCISIYEVAIGRNDQTLKAAAIDCMEENFDELADDLESNIKDPKLWPQLCRRMAKRPRL